MEKNKDKKAYIIGSGIAGLATTTYLLTDAGFKGENIFIYDQEVEAGGSFDGQGSAESGYSFRGYRIFEKMSYSATYDFLSKIPSLASPGKNLKEEFFSFNEKIYWQ